MISNFAPCLMPCCKNVGYTPIYPNSYMTSPVLQQPEVVLSPLQQDCFVKSHETTPEATEEEQEKLGRMMQNASYSVSELQSKIRDKEKELENNKNMLRQYPDNPKYGREIDRLNKEIVKLKEELAEFY